MTRGLIALTAVALLSIAACAPVGLKKHAAVPLPPRPMPHAKPADDQPYAAAEHYVAQRVVDGGAVPMERYLEARRRMERMPLYSIAARATVDAKDSKAREASLGSWTQLGPGNFGGRTRSLLIHPTLPDIMYAGAVGGGVWKTTDGGRSWRPMLDFAPYLAVSTMAMDPRDPNIIYAGTGEGFSNADRIRGGGIYRSVNGGDTWTILTSTLDPRFYFVRKLVISPADSRRLYAATAAGVLRSVNAGASWELVLDRGVPHRGCTDLVIRTDVAQDGVIAACGMPQAGSAAAGLYNKDDPREDFTLPAVIFRNVDAAGAGRWEQVLSDPNLGRISLALAPSDQKIVYALAASREPGEKRDGMFAVYRSLNFGETGSWTTRARNTDTNRLNTMLLTNPLRLCTPDFPISSQGTYDNVIAVDPADPNRVWAGGIDLFRSDDGGATWGIASFWWDDDSAHADHHVLVFHPAFNGTTNQVLFNANDGGVYRTDNARAAVGTGDRAPCTVTSRINWRSLNNGYVVSQFYQGSAFAGGYIAAGGLQDNGTVVGGDASGAGGWRKIFGGDGTFLVANPVDHNHVYAATFFFDLRRSTDGGAIFQNATRGITESRDTNFLAIAPLVMDPREPRRLWTGGTALWRTTDGAQNWTQASTRVAEERVSAIAVAPQDPNLVYAGTARGQIHRTEQGLSAGAGTAWPFSQPRVGFVSSIAVDPADIYTVYATYSSFNRSPEDRHVYRSRDGGVTWLALDGEGDTGLPDVPAQSIAVDPFTPTTLYVGTDLGLFVSADGGATWAREDAPFPNAPVYHVVLQRDGPSAWLFAFTHGRGAWRVPLRTRGCAYSISSGSTVFPAGGGFTNIEVDAPSDCAWSVSSAAEWVTISSGSQGRGRGTVRLQANMNDDGSPRSGRVWIGDKQHAVTQGVGEFLSFADEIDGAVNISRLPWMSYHDTRRSTTNPADPVASCTGARDSKSVWFRLQPTFSGRVQVVVRNVLYTAFANARPVLTAYEGAVGPEFERGCAVNRAANPDPAEISFAVTAGRPYLIRVSNAGDQGAGGFLVISVRQAEAQADVIPSVLDFGDVLTGQPVERVVSVRNLGNAPFELRTVTVSSSLFEVRSPRVAVTVPNRTAQPVPNDPEQLVLVRFTPVDAGPVNATLNFVTSDPARSTLSIPVTANVIVPLPATPALAVAPESLSFGDVTVGQTRELPLALVNTGNTELQVDGVNSSDGQFATDASFPMQIPAGFQRILTVRFTPASAGAKPAVLSIASNDPKRGSLDVPLSGAGVNP